MLTNVARYIAVGLKLESCKIKWSLPIHFSDSVVVRLLFSHKAQCYR